MNPAEKLFFASVAVALLVALGAGARLATPAWRARLSAWRVALALLLTPVVLVLVVTLAGRGVAAAHALPVARCAGIADPQAAAFCDAYVAVFEGLITTFAFSLGSFGLLPLATFLALLLALCALARPSAPGPDSP